MLSSFFRTLLRFGTEVCALPHISAAIVPANKIGAAPDSWNIVHSAVRYSLKRNSYQAVIAGQCNFRACSIVRCIQQAHDARRRKIDVTQFAARFVGSPAATVPAPGLATGVRSLRRAARPADDFVSASAVMTSTADCFQCKRRISDDLMFQDRHSMKARLT